MFLLYSYSKLCYANIMVTGQSNTACSFVSSVIFINDKKKQCAVVLKQLDYILIFTEIILTGLSEPLSCIVG